MGIIILVLAGGALAAPSKEAAALDEEMMKAEFESETGITGDEGEGDDGDEGDMILTKEQKQMLENSVIKNDEDQAKQEMGGFKQSFMGSKNYLWPDKTLNYDLSEISFWRFITKSKIRGAVNDLAKQLGGCIRFKETEKGPRVLVKRENGCSSNVGYVAQYSGTQDMHVGKGECSTGNIQHEFIHALGFYHTMSRPDRDKYVTVHFGNIKAKKENNFQKFGAIQTFDLPFDYGSMMMYRGNAFGIGGSTTITAKDPSKQGIMGQRKRLSDTDIKMIRKAYGCD